MKAFRAPKQSLGDLDAEVAATLIAHAVDVALILGGGGVIQDIAFQRADLSLELEGYGKWLGRTWVETATVESQPKVEAMMREAAIKTASSWRQVDHPSSSGIEVPILYCAVQVGPGGRCVVLGRDQRAIAALQQSLVETQMSMERDYSRLRHVETRYRVLFQMSSEPVLMVDASSHKVVEANPAAAELLGEAPGAIVGRSFPDAAGFDARSAQAVRALLDAARVARQPDSVRVAVAGRGSEFLVAASTFRQETSTLFLVRLTPLQPNLAAAALPKPRSKLLQLIDKAHDGFVVTDRDGRIVAANAAFLDMAQLTREDQVRGELIERWLGRGGVDFNVVMGNLRQHGSLPLFATTLRAEYGTSTEIEISAVSLDDGDQPSFGFTIRNTSRRLAVNRRQRAELPRSLEQLTELIGRVPLKDLVRETTDVIERMCVEAALTMTNDNRALAAEMLGLSRQSLYVKLRRYGIADLPAGSETEDG